LSGKDAAISTLEDKIKAAVGSDYTPAKNSERENASFAYAKAQLYLQGLETSELVELKDDGNSVRAVFALQDNAYRIRLELSHRGTFAMNGYLAQQVRRNNFEYQWSNFVLELFEKKYSFILSDDRIGSPLRYETYGHRSEELLMSLSEVYEVLNDPKLRSDFKRIRALQRSRESYQERLDAATWKLDETIGQQVR